MWMSPSVGGVGQCGFDYFYKFPDEHILGGKKGSMLLPELFVAHWGVDL